MKLSYAVVTPARDEVQNLPRLARSLLAQRVRPAAWLIVDNGSTDRTPAVAEQLVRRHAWIEFLVIPGGRAQVRGGPVVRAFEAGAERVRHTVDIVVKVDADTSFGPEYFEALVRAFESDPSLGIASGTCYEQDPDGEWRERLGTESSVWGATRAYRSACLDHVLPLDGAMGWDGIDVLKAHMNGWTTGTRRDLPFRHHRAEGERDGRRWVAWAAQGRASHYMGYRPSYLLLRTLHHTRREPSAVAMLWGFAAAKLSRSPRCSDGPAVAFLRRSQRLRTVPSRMRDVASPQSLR